MYLEKQYRNRFKIASKGRVLLMVSAMASCVSLSYAAPTGGVVSSGSATINTSGTNTTINQSTQKAIINWQDFSIGKNETVDFKQPNASAITLNRVVGSNKSILEGTLNANGKVYLVNQNGVLISKGAKVNTAGFLASTLNITDENFNKGNFVFSGNGAQGDVINLGTITAKEEGYVVLLGRQVSNEGTIIATKGTVALSSGNKITLNFNGSSLVDVTIDEGTLNALVETKQAIIADGGKVILTAKAADDLIASQVNIEGLVQAQTIDDLKGDIKIYAYGGTTTVVGTLDASAPTEGDGGFIETSGDKVTIKDSATITTKSTNGQSGTWLIDPKDFTIGTGGDITGALLSQQLSNGNVVIESTNGSEEGEGNIYVNDAVSWSANTLTLDAENSIYVNNVMNATGSASFEAIYGSGTNSDGVPFGLYTKTGNLGEYIGKLNFTSTGSVTLNSENYIVINSNADFMAISSSNMSNNYILGSDIDLSGQTWISSSSIGSEVDPYSGKFNGFGHLIKNITTTPQNELNGIFAYTSNTASLSNIGLSGIVLSMSPSVSSTKSVGSLVGTNYGSIANSFVSYSENGNGNLNIYFSGNSDSGTGGLVGRNYGLIANSYTNTSLYVSSSNLDAIFGLGGLVGINDGTIVSSYMLGSVTLSALHASNTTYFGGLVGLNNGNISKSYTQGSVSTSLRGKTNYFIGGFVGGNFGTIYNAYANNKLTQGEQLGGFVGLNGMSGTIYDTYSAGSQKHQRTTANLMAGFVFNNQGNISTSYTATTMSSISGSAAAFVMNNTGTITNSYWDSSISGLVSDSTEGVTKLSADEAKDIANYIGFDSAMWVTSGEGHPLLKSLEDMPIYVIASVNGEYGLDTISATSFQYVGLQWVDKNAYSNVFSLNVPSQYASSSGYLNAGMYDASEVIDSSLFDNISGTVTITKRSLFTMTDGNILNLDKVYDGTTVATVNNPEFSTGIGDETLVLVYDSAAFTNANAGTKGLYIYNPTLTDGSGDASNYTFSYDYYDPWSDPSKPSFYTTAKIIPKDITATYDVTTKIYDGATAANITWTGFEGVVSSDQANITIATLTGNYENANVGTNKTVYAKGTISGSAASNYNLVTSESEGDITPKSVQILGYKTEDGTTSINGTELYVVNSVGNDEVSLHGSASFTSATEGSHLLDISGLFLDNPNYTLANASGEVIVSFDNNALSGGVVTSGTATITNTNNSTVIDQSSDKAVINWQNFSIPQNYSVIFNQPSSTSMTLNRVLGNRASIIEGLLSANGRVFIVNENGILFKAGSSINTASFLASTLNITQDDFINSHYVFIASANAGSVINQGDIVIVDGGFNAFLGKDVENTGNINTGNGAILFASAQNVELDLNDLNNLSADGITGQVLLSSTMLTSDIINAYADNFIIAEDTIFHSAIGLSLYSNGDFEVSNDESSTLKADELENSLAQTSVYLKTKNGDVNIYSPVSWNHNTLGLYSNKNINIYDTLTASGNASFEASWGQSWRGTPEEYYLTYDLLVRPVKDVVLYGLNFSYTKDSAGNDLDTFTGKIDFTGTGTVKMGVEGDLEGYEVIQNVEDLVAINSDTTNMSKNYILGADLELSSIDDWTPIGYINGSKYIFNGSFEGFGHTISHLTSTENGLFYWIGARVYRISSTEGYGGDYQLLSGVSISNLGLVDLDISVTLADNISYGMIGGLAGASNAIMRNVFATGDISVSAPIVYQSHAVGGLLGSAGGIIQNSYSRVNVTAHNFQEVGSFAGIAGAESIEDSYATGNVKGTADYEWLALQDGAMMFVGGFAGSVIGDGFINNAYSTGDVYGMRYIGGFAGKADSAIYNSRASGNVTFDDSILPPALDNNNVYNDEIRNTGSAGGFVGLNTWVITNSSSSGRVESVSGDKKALGAFAGYSGNDMGMAFSINNYFNKDTAGLDSFGRGGEVTEHDMGMGGSGTPIADALGLTPEQLHGGMQGLTNEEYAHIGELTSGKKTLSDVKEQIASDKATAQAHQAAREETATQAHRIDSQILAQAQKQNTNSINSILAMFGSNSSLEERVMNNVDIVNPNYQTDVKSITVDGVTYVTDESDDEEKKKKAH